MSFFTDIFFTQFINDPRVLLLPLPFQLHRSKAVVAGVAVDRGVADGHGVDVGRGVDAGRGVDVGRGVELGEFDNGQPADELGDGLGDVLVADVDRGVDVDHGGDVAHGDDVDRGDHDDELDEFDNGQPADAFGGVRGDVLVVDDGHGGRGDVLVVDDGRGGRGDVLVVDDGRGGRGDDVDHEQLVDDHLLLLPQHLLPVQGILSALLQRKKGM